MRIALTGAATGIGAEVAARLKSEDHEVIAFDISKPADNVDRWIETDMSQPSSIENAIASADGSFDVLINNAGLPPREGQSNLVLNVNYIGFKHFLDGMVRKMNAGASIVNTASRAGAMWRDNLDQVKKLMAIEKVDQLDAFILENNIDHVRAYNLSKEAVIVSTIAKTEEMIRHDLRMNSVSPAAVSTGILEDFVAAFGEKVAKNIMRAGRPGTPAEIADVICFLASPKSHWIKGQDIVIDGGMGSMTMTDMLDLKN